MLCLRPPSAFMVILILLGVGWATEITGASVQYANCSTMTTPDGCLNDPGYRSCYWCEGPTSVSSFCSNYSVLTTCLQASCYLSTDNVSCTTTAVNSLCGWCLNPAVGYPNCLYGGRTTHIPPSSCGGGWTKSTYRPCESASNATACGQMSSQCAWCNEGFCSSSANDACTDWYARDCTSFTSMPTCVAATCGWCDAPACSTQARCQQNAARQPPTCASGWMSKASLCSRALSFDSCLNHPNVTTCCWYAGSCTYNTDNMTYRCISSPCYAFTDLNSCTTARQSSRCGWCGDSGRCLYSGVNGSGPSACAGGWNPSTYVPCEALTTSTACDASVNGCSWCATFCTPDDGCDGADCTLFTTQQTCVDTTFCGWCDDPVNSTSRCQPWSRLVLSTCAAKWIGRDTTCPSMTTADTCLNNQNYSKCYWCGGTTCKGHQAVDCVASPCRRTTNQSVCTTTLDYQSCGWCADSGTCLFSGVNGSRPSACAALWNPSTYVPCEALTTSSACNASDNNCVWCSVLCSQAACNLGDCTLFTTSTTCTSISFCGWCDAPAGSASPCQPWYMIQPGMCTDPWVGQPATCSQMTTIEACYNNPSYSMCYWCEDKICTGTWSVGCSFSKCSTSRDIVSCTTSASYTNCGWCGDSGRCMYSGVNGSRPSACAGVWNPSTYVPCEASTTEIECNASTHSCVWCAGFCTSTPPCTTYLGDCSWFTTSATCAAAGTTSPFCGWCDVPVGYASHCQAWYGIQPSTCAVQWVGKPATCSEMTTAESCLNNPVYKWCYWCGTMCTNRPMATCFRGTCYNAVDANACTSESTRVSCGWCDSPSPGFANCLYNNATGTRPPSCPSGANWTQHWLRPCEGASDASACGSGCYWCAGFCTASPSCEPGSCPKYATLTTCVAASCGWCGSIACDSPCQPFSMYRPPTCVSGWTTKAAQCSSAETQEACFNHPNVTTCYWCGSSCSNESTSTLCITSSCSGTSSPSACLTQAAYAACGWCAQPQDGGNARCLFRSSTNTTSAPPLSCLGGWSPSVYRPCAEESTPCGCRANANPCYWCSAFCSASPLCGPESCSVYKNSTTCVAASCSWCDTPACPMDASCQPFSMNLPSTCTAGWVVSVTPKCRDLTSIDGCLNSPLPCYWCGSYCTNDGGNLSGCTQSSCNHAEKYACLRSYVGACGWCAVPRAGYSNCLHAGPAGIRPSACPSAWAIPCAWEATASGCRSNLNVCYWCSGFCSVDSRCDSMQGGCSQYVTNTTCLAASCGWCDIPIGAISPCQGGSTLTPSTCATAWGGIAATCSAMTTAAACLQTQSPTGCVWCGTYCSYRADPRKCVTSEYCTAFDPRGACIMCDRLIEKNSCISNTYCGWCSVPPNGQQNCLYSANGTQPSNCTSEWTASISNACGAEINACGCKANWNGCYWCTQRGGFCFASEDCADSTRCSDYTAPTTCIAAACSWCDHPIDNAHRCQDTTLISVTTCPEAWLNVESMCTSQKTIGTCLNNPNVSSCYWCGSHCAATSTSSTCFQSDCASSTVSDACTVSASYAGCGWCATPSPALGGTMNCLYSGAAGNAPKTCASGWTPSIVNCASETTPCGCRALSSQCRWCHHGCALMCVTTSPSSTSSNSAARKTFSPSLSTSLTFSSSVTVSVTASFTERSVSGTYPSVSTSITTTSRRKRTRTRSAVYPNPTVPLIDSAPVKVAIASTAVIASLGDAGIAAKSISILALLQACQAIGIVASNRTADGMSIDGRHPLTFPYSILLSLAIPGSEVPEEDTTYWRLRYYRGAVVGNGVLVPLIWGAIATCLAAIAVRYKMHRWKKDRKANAQPLMWKLWAGAAMVGFPGIVASPVEIYADGAVAGAFVLAVANGEWGYVALGLTVVSLVMLTVVIVVFQRPVYFDPTFYEADRQETRKLLRPERPATRSKWVRWFNGVGEWEPLAAGPPLQSSSSSSLNADPSDTDPLEMQLNPVGRTSVTPLPEGADLQAARIWRHNWGVLFAKHIGTRWKVEPGHWGRCQHVRNVLCTYYSAIDLNVLLVISALRGIALAKPALYCLPVARGVLIINVLWFIVMILLRPAVSTIQNVLALSIQFVLTCTTVAMYVMMLTPGMDRLRLATAGLAIASLILSMMAALVLIVRKLLWLWETITDTLARWQRKKETRGVPSAAQQEALAAMMGVDITPLPTTEKRSGEGDSAERRIPRLPSALMSLLSDSPKKHAGYDAAGVTGEIPTPTQHTPPMFRTTVPRVPSVELRTRMYVDQILSNDDDDDDGGGGANKGITSHQVVVAEDQDNESYEADKLSAAAGIHHSQMDGKFTRSAEQRRRFEELEKMLRGRASASPQPML